MMKVLLTLVALIVSVNLLKADGICTPKQPNPSAPQLPTVDYSYVSEVVSKYVERKRVFLQYVNHDANKNMASVLTKYGSWINGYMWNTKTLEGHWFNESSCISYQHSNISGEGRSLEMIFGYPPGNWFYEGTATLRGQTLNLWSSCVNQNGQNYLSYYYFNQNNIPFRYVLQEKVQGYSMNIIKDFFKFVKVQPDPDAFVVPKGMFCPSSISYPNPLPKSASYHEEDSDPALKSVQASSIVFDKTAQVSLGRIGNTTLIQDYKRGIQFKIVDGVCTRVVLARVGRPDETMDSNGNVHMSTLSHFLLSDGKYTYNGKDIVRGIPVDVYSASGRSAEQYGTFNTLILYMGQEKVKFWSNDGFTYSMINPLVRVQFVTGKPPLVLKQFEIYDFQGGQLPLGYPFRMDECYSRNETITFNLYVNTTDSDISYEVRTMVAAGIIAKITNLLDLPFLRVQVTSTPHGASAFMVKNKQLLVLGVIYAQEATSTRFSEQINTRQPLSKGVVFTKYDNPGNTPTLCAEYCANITSRPFDSKEWCSSFMFNRLSKQCIFLHSYFFRMSTVASMVTDLYTRSFSQYRDYKSSRQVWTDIQTAVKAGSIVYNDKDESNNVMGVYKVVKVEETVEADYHVAEPDDPTMNHFVTMSPGTLFGGTPVESLDSVTQRSCALRCFNSLKYYCKGFHHIWAPNQMTCQLYDNIRIETLSDYEMKNKDKKQRYSPKEDVFKIRNQYEQFLPIGGKTMLMDSTDYVYTDIDSHGCAELCLRNTEIFCQSYESCGDVCLLDSRHMYNSPKSSFKTNKECIHFSRIYIDDYVKIPNKKALADSGVIELKAISVQKCAHLCSTSPDYECNVFEYCDVASTCLLVPKQVDQTSQLAYKTTGTCDLYKRRPHINRAVNFASSQSASGRYSPGAMGGMAIGMLILGCVLLIVIGILIFKLRSPGGGDGSAGFNRNHLAEDE